MTIHVIETIYSKIMTPFTIDFFCIVSLFDDEADALVFAILVRKIRIDILYFLTQTEIILVALQRSNIVGSNVTKFNIVINGTGKKQSLDSPINSKPKMQRLTDHSAKNRYHHVRLSRDH